MSFELLDIIKPIHKALTTEGYAVPTPIQTEAIPKILEGRDILGSAQTGTGKTAAFAVPILQLLHSENAHANKNKVIQALILAPTRELALQISESFTTYGRLTGLRNAVVFGGVAQKPQTDALKKGVDILIATPGRLIDLIGQGLVNLEHVKIFVLDEADRMLDMGFIHDINKVLGFLPEKRQNLLFSATIPTEIAKLAEKILHDPVTIEISPETPTVEAIQQGVYYVAKPNKKFLLLHVLKEQSAESVIVFTRTKHGAEYVARYLNKAGIAADAIHSDKVQKARQRALQNFKDKAIRVLVATDIAARGLDIEALGLVINYEIPNMPDSYIHRIGRTGRAGLNGLALSFCDEEEKAYLKDIAKTIGFPVPEMSGYPFALGTTEIEKNPELLQKRQQQNRNHAQQRGRQQQQNRPHHRTPRPEKKQEAGEQAKTAEHKPRPHAPHKPKEGQNSGGQAVAGTPHKPKHPKTHHPKAQGAAKPKSHAPGHHRRPKPDSEQEVNGNTTAPVHKKRQQQKPYSDKQQQPRHGKKSEVWSNDASFNKRKPRKQTNPKAKGAQQPTDNKNKQPKLKVISNDYKPVYDKTSGPVKMPLKREKLSWYERLGFTTKKRKSANND